MLWQTNARAQLLFEMRRFLTHTIIIMALFAIIHPLMAWLAGRSPLPCNVNYLPNNYGHSGLRLAEADTVSPALLFIGSSHCYRTFDTRHYDSLGIRTFNLGSSNQTPMQSLALLRRYLPKYKEIEPHLNVVVEIHPDVVGNTGVESAVDIISNTHLDCHVVRMALSLKNIRVFNTLLCASMDRFVCGNPLQKASSKIVLPGVYDTADSLLFCYQKGGFVEVSNLCWRPTRIAPFTIITDPGQMSALKDIVAMLETQGIPYLFVEVPATKTLYRSYTNHDDFERQIRMLLPDSNLYVNLNDDKRLASLLDDSTCYFDEDHLNQKGIRLFNMYITYYNVLPF